MDNAFSSKYNSEAKNYYGDKDDFVSIMNTARDNAVRNAYARIPNEPKEYRDFNYEYEAAKFYIDNATQIYRGEDDPREAANAHNLAKIINKMYPTIPVDVAEKSYRPIIKSITGDDMSATNLMQVFGKTFANNFNSLLLGGRVYMHSMLSQPFQEGLPEEIQKKREEEYKQRIDEIKAAKGLNQRTDYYNKDFDSFIEQAVLSSATIIPSMIFSVGPEILGATLSAFTKMPIFYSIGHGVSAASAAFMEAGGSALEMYDAGADWDTIRGFSTIVGLANGVLEIVGNIPEYKINKALFGMQKLRKAVGATAGTELTRGLASTVFKKMAVNYGFGLVLEPGTEALQEMVSMYGMNLASKWEQTHKGKSFSDEFTFTPQEMIDAMKEVAVSTFKGQLLVGLVGEGVDLYTNLRKSGQFLYNENTNTGFKWDAGDLRKIYDARKYSTFDSKSTFTNSDTIVTDKKTKAYSPAETDKKGNPTEKITPVNVRSIGGEFVPTTKEEMAKAKYMKEHSDGMYINIVNDESVTNEAMNSEGLKKIINSLPDEVDKHSVDYSFTEQGDIVISSKSDLNQIVKEFVNENIDRVSNVHETENGYTVTVDGQNVNFTTDAENATSFSQTDYVRSARETAETKKDEMTHEWESRINDIQDRAREVQKLDSRKKASAFRSEINKVINSKIKDNEQRKAERAKIMSQTDKIAKETEKAYNAAIANNPNSDFAKAFKDRNVSEASKSFARGTVMAVSKLAQSMGMNTSEFLDKVNFKYSVESMKGGKERAGWTEVHSDGTFDINVTSFLDQSTGIHEMGHAYLSMLGDNYKAIEGFEDVFKKELEQDKGKVGRNTQEAFAEALEAYVNEGLAKSEGLRKVFDIILDSLRNFVNAVKELLSPEKVAMFDNLFEKGLKDYNPEEQTYTDNTFFAKDIESSADVEEAKRQYDDVVAKYKDTDQWMKAPNGKPTNLTERQWVIVRTPNFINWFGDWINDPENASKMLDENGEPKVFYHGTKYDFDVFAPTRYQDRLSYFALDRAFSEEWVRGRGEGQRPQEITDRLENVRKERNKYIEEWIESLNNPEWTRELYDEMYKKEEEFEREHLDGMTWGEANQLMGARIIEVFINSRTPFIPSYDFEKVADTILDAHGFNETQKRIFLENDGKKALQDGAYIYYENKAVVDKLKELGFDSLSLSERSDGEITTVATMYPNQIKSVDNKGTFSNDTGNIYFKDADIDMSEDEVADRLGKGLFVPNEVLDKYPDHPFVKLERLVQNIVGTKPEWFKLYKRSVDEYLKETGLSLEDFDKWNYRQILNDWNKRLKGANEYMEIPVDTNGDYIYFLRRLNAYANMESPERAETAWMDKLNHTRYGRDNIRNLALEMDKLGLFDDKLEGYDLSARFPALNMIANKAKSSDERGTRVRIDVSVYDQAKDEAFRNRQFIREKMNDDNTNIYEANIEESDTNVNYMESADIQEILKEKDVSREIKTLVKNGMWDGTVVRDLMHKSTETLRKLNRTNTTLELTERELNIEKERVKIYQSEIDKLEHGVSENNKAEMQRYKDKLHEAKVRIYDLELTKNALSDLLAAEKLSAALYKTQRQILDIVKAKNGEADADRALRETVKRIVNFTKKNRTKNPKLAVKVDLEEMKYQHDGEGNRVKDEEGNYIIGKAPNLAKFLEDNKIVDKEGNLLRGIDKMDVNELKAFKKAVQTDKENSKSRHKQDQRQFEAKTQSLASKILTSMKPKQVEKKLTDEDRKAIKNEVEKRTEGKDLTKAKREQIEGEVLGEVLAKKIQDIADGARYGIESHTEETNKRHIMKDFLTLSRLLREISPELEKFVMDGLNKMTDGKYRMVDSRMKTFFDNIKAEYKFKTDKELKTFLNSLVTDRREIGRVERENIPQRLKNNKLFMEMWDKDEKNPKRQAHSKFKYSIQDMMAIEEQSLEWDGLRHLNGGCEIPAAEIAWVVSEFESKDGSLAYYKPAADEIRRVYGERFDQLYDTVLSVENREMTKVSFYSPMFGVGLDKDLMMKFSDLFGDDRKAQANWFTKDREFGTNAIDLNYYSRLEKVVEMQEAYINGAEFYRQLDHLFSENGGNLRNIISEVYGAPQFKRIEGILDLTKSDAVRNVISEADNMASKIRNHYVMARLAYNMSSVFQQVGSWFLGFSKYGPMKLWKSSLQFIMHPIEMSKRVYELSPQMKHAVNPLLRMAYETGKANPTTAFGKIDKFVASIGEKGLTLMEKQDHIIRNILWWTAYQDEIAKAQKKSGGELTAEQKDECQRNATQWVLDIQSSSQVKDNSMMYSGGNLFWKQVLMFTNQLNKEWNMLYFDAIKEGLFQKQYGKFFANFAALGFATMWVVACTGKIKNDEDDDETWAEDLLKDWGFEFASRIPVAGNLVKNVYEGFSYKQNDDIVSRLTQAILTLANDKAKKKSKITALKNVGWSGLDLFGAPTTAIKRFSQAFEDGEIMEADHFMRLFGGEWYKYFEE